MSARATACSSRECHDVRVTALTWLGFLEWLGLLALAIAAILGLVALAAFFNGFFGGGDGPL
jgi:hypothetical protein